jgi:hypothetical protein
MSMKNWIRVRLGLPPLAEHYREDDLCPSWLFDEEPPAVAFSKLHVVNRTPRDIPDGEMFLVEYRGRRYWTVFRCPCRCGEVITLMAESDRGPTWRVNRSKLGRPCLRPSVWRMAGCHSHFWVHDGRVYWCLDSGREPWLVAPDDYKKPA